MKIILTLISKIFFALNSLAQIRTFLQMAFFYLISLSVKKTLKNAKNYLYFTDFEASLAPRDISFFYSKMIYKASLLHFRNSQKVWIG
mgnify:CR=1 FL=1